MSGQKRSRIEDDQEEHMISKKHGVTKRTVKKWIAENDKSLQTLRWLHFKMSADHEHVAILKCAVCSQFKEKLVFMQNFRPAFINGTTNICVSVFKDHAETTMHCRAMILDWKQQESSAVEYAPIAKALWETNIDEATKRKLKRKFDVAYMIAKVLLQ